MNVLFHGIVLLWTNSGMHMLCMFTCLILMIVSFIGVK